MTSFRAGQRVDDLCRACKATRDHTVMAVGQDGIILLVVCDFCGSEHNYRHGAPPASRPRTASSHPAPPPRSEKGHPSPFSPAGEADPCRARSMVALREP